MHKLILTREDRDASRKPLTLRRLRETKRTQGMLYTAVRSRLGLTQAAMAALLKLPMYAVVNRKRCKRTYTLTELAALQEVSGLSDSEWCDLIREIAKLP